MNKSELIDAVASTAGLTKSDVSKMMDAFMETVTKSLTKGEQVLIPGFCSFSTTERAARAGRNPQTGAVIQIKASKVVKFKVGNKLKEAVSQA